MAANSNDPLGSFLYNDPTNGGKKSIEGIHNNQMNIKSNEYNDGFLYNQNTDHSESYSPNTYVTNAEPRQVGRPASDLNSTSDLVFGDVSKNIKTQTSQIQSQSNTPAMSTTNFASNNSTNDISSLSNMSAGNYQGVPVDYQVSYNDTLSALQTYQPETANMISQLETQMSAKGIDPFSDPQFQNLIGTAKGELEANVKARMDQITSSNSNNRVDSQQFSMLNSLYSKLSGFSNLQNLDDKSVTNMQNYQNAITEAALQKSGMLNPFLNSQDLSKMKSVNAKSELKSSSAFKNWVQNYFKGAENSSTYKELLTSFSTEGTLVQNEKNLLFRLSDQLEKDGVKDLYKQYKSEGREEDFSSELKELLDIADLTYSTRETDLLDQLDNNFSFLDNYSTIRMQQASSAPNTSTSYGGNNSNYYN